MKRLIFVTALFCAAVCSSCNEFDDTEIWNKLDNHEERLSALEELCKQMNTNLNALQTIVEAVEKRDHVTNVSPIRKDGEIVGYTIAFANSDTITIYNGEDGADGKDGANGKNGYTPQIGVMKDTDNIYYWTLDGEWLLDGKGNKIKAVGTDGKDGKDGTNGKDGVNGTDGKDGADGADGQDGVNGTDGKDGADGVTPRLKIEDDYWYISYDNGATWEKLGKATGEDGSGGSDGADGAGGDSFFKDVTTTDDYVIFTLADGTELTVPRTVQISGNKIYYTTSDGTKIFHDKEYTYFGALIVSNIYRDGQGVLTFDDTVTKIGAEAFKENKRLTSITIPDSVTEIGIWAFRNCSSLTSITIPDSVTSIGDWAISGCTSLTSVTIPDSVTEIGDYAFNGCTSLTSITIGNGVTEIGEGAFRNCSSLTTITIPDSVTSIGSSAFDGCTSLKSVTIGDSVTEIGRSAFYDCTSLTSITIPDGVTKIGDYAFYGCTSLKEVYCKPITPPWGGSIIFSYYYSGNDSSKPIGCKIYVPKNSSIAYKQAEGWKEYASYIVGYDFE